MLKEKPFLFPSERSIRVICDTDARNECDDQYCIAHLWMTPRFDVKAMIGAQYGNVFHQEGTAEKSYDELVLLADLMGIRNKVSLLHGGSHAMLDEHTPVESEGARFIVEEALRDDPRPLFVCCLGSATDIASAYLMEPRISDKLTVIWIGGVYPDGGFEFNQANDLHAARVLYKSKLDLWQVPMGAYANMKVSFFELLTRVYPYGAISKYLVENTMQVAEAFANMTPPADFDTSSTDGAPELVMGGDLWNLGDSPVVGLMLNPTTGTYQYQDAPCDVFDDGRYDWSNPGSRKIRVYSEIDNRLILNDMFEKFRFYFG